MLKILKFKEMKDKKFIEVFDTDEWEVETDSGWEDIIATGKTIDYKVWEIVLDGNMLLRCADNHILINEKFNEVYTKDLTLGDDIITKFGLRKVISISETDNYEEMYDIEVDSINHTYFTNNILSHNSMWLGNLALRSAQMGNQTAYISFELQEEIIMMRIGANMFNIPLDDYEDWAKDQDRLKKKMNSIKQSSVIPFGTLHTKEFPSSSCSVNDLRTYLKKAEDTLGIKFDNIFVDYINIMKNWRNPNTENTYMKIKQIAEDLRAMAMEEMWTVITATQTNRGGWETSDLNVTNISESAALLHTVDILFGIITNAEMKAKGEYLLKCLANRVAGYENTRKRYTMDWAHARIEEDKESPIQDMDFVVNNTIDSVGHSTPRGQGSTDIHSYISSHAAPVPPETSEVKMPGSLSEDITISGSTLF